MRTPLQINTQTVLADVNEKVRRLQKWNTVFPKDYRNQEAPGLFIGAKTRMF